MTRQSEYIKIARLFAYNRNFVKCGKCGKKVSILNAGATSINGYLCGKCYGGRKMTQQEFAKNAIKNGYTGNSCEGWEWIRANLEELDYIFQTEEYKNQKGMKYLCMPLILGNKDYEKIETDVLSTAWYLNNERQSERKKQAYFDTMEKDGWIPLSEDIVKQAITEGKKILIKDVTPQYWFTIDMSNTYKPFVSSKGKCVLMKLKSRSRGYPLYQFENAFCKIV